MSRSIYESVMQSLGDSKESFSEIAEGSGVPLSTVTRIARGATKDPSVHAIEDLHRYFERRERARLRKAG